MNVLLFLLLSLAAFYLAWRFHSRWISRILRSSDRLPTPAQAQADGRDFVSTPFPVLFSHHYATIAGAGPIVGPTIACVYGIWPTWLWIVLGSIFIGAVHDYTSMFISMRERGRTIADITGSLTGRGGFLLYISFTLVLVIIVTAAFLDLSVRALTSLAPASLLELPAANPFGWQTSAAADGSILVSIGGIATTGVIIITLFAPLVGWLMYRRGQSSGRMALLSLVVAALSVFIGMHFPLSFSGLDEGQVRTLWMLLLGGYTLAASALPVWLLLQPRDFVNSFTLYGGMALLFASAVAGGFAGMRLDPAMSFTIAEGTRLVPGAVFPILFITVACGAISGFHSLVTSGTSSKQAAKESDARRVGYGAMLFEGLLAVLVICAVGAGLGHQQLLALQFPEGAQGNPVLSFALGAGLFAKQALGLPVYLGTIFGLLMVEGFLVTTLDTAVRLNRYLFEELWNFFFAGRTPALLRNPLFNSLLSVVAMLALAFPNGWKLIWPVFGTANQLLAALTLATVSIWLACRARPAWFTLLPAAFMMLTCLWNLTLIVGRELTALRGADGAPNWSVLVLALLLYALGLGVVALCAGKLWEVYSGRREKILSDPADEYLAIKATPD